MRKQISGNYNLVETFFIFRKQLLMIREVKGWAPLQIIPAGWWWWGENTGRTPDYNTNTPAHCHARATRRHKACLLFMVCPSSTSIIPVPATHQSWNPVSWPGITTQSGAHILCSELKQQWEKRKRNQLCTLSTISCKGIIMMQGAGKHGFLPNFMAAIVLLRRERV